MTNDLFDPRLTEQRNPRTVDIDMDAPEAYEYTTGSNVMVAVVSFGMNWNCKGEDWSFRADIATTQDFINSFLSK